MCCIAGLVPHDPPAGREWWMDDARAGAAERLNHSRGVPRMQEIAYVFRRAYVCEAARRGAALCQSSWNEGRNLESMSAFPWWRGAVIYQIYPRSFLDTNGDGVGDLEGIAARLDYVAGLGVDAIWVSPFFKSPMADFGYDIADFRAVDPLFGDLADFDRLVAQAHAR